MCFFYPSLAVSSHLNHLNALKRLMAPSRNYPNGVRGAVVVLILSLTFLPSKPVGVSYPSYDENLKKLVLGSRPPRCVNKCLSCRPCMATLVIPPHQRRDVRTSSSHEKDNSYYLLSWKCKCGDKLFQP